MLTRLALLLLSASCCLRASWGQEVEGEDIVDVLDFLEEEYDNGANDSSVAGIFYRDSLYLAINTGNVDIGGDANGGLDFVVKKVDADLEDEEVVQLGGDGDDVITAIAAPDASATISDIVIVGSTMSTDVHLFPDQFNATGEMDWFIATLSRSDLTTSAYYVNGTIFEDQEATAVAVTEDGEYVVAGWTAGDYFSTNAGAANDDDGDGATVGFDLWVVKMDSELSDDFLWSVQMGTIAYEEPTAVVVGEDGNVYVVGNTKDFSDVLTDAEKDEFQSMFVYCLNGDDGEVEWSWTEDDLGVLGVLSDEGEAHGAVLTTKGTTALYVSGNTKGLLPDFEGETTDSAEMFIVSLDPENGDVNWVWQSEANATAFGTGGIVLDDDGVTPIVSGIAFGNQFNLSFTHWESGSGNMFAAMVDPEEQEVLMYYTAHAVNNETRQDPFSLVKAEDEDFVVYMIGTNDGEWDKNSDPEDETNYLVLKVELAEFPEEDDDDDDGRDFPYWYVGVPVFAIGGVLFLVAYKWAAASQAAKAKQATMV